MAIMVTAIDAAVAIIVKITTLLKRPSFVRSFTIFECP